MNRKMGKTTYKDIMTSKYLMAVLMLFGLFFFYAFLGPVNSESNDDTAMNLIASGACGDAAQDVIFNSVLYGGFLKAMSMVLPGVNWYLAMQLLLNFAAVAVIGVCLAYYLNKEQTMVAVLLLHFYAAREVYENIQFTENAALYSIAAFSLIGVSLQVKHYRNITTTAGVAFLGLAILIRDKVLLLLAPIGAVFLILWGGQLFEDIDKEEKTSRLKRLLWIGMICAAIFGINRLFQQELFWKKAEWKEYAQYHLQGTVPLLDNDQSSFDLAKATGEMHPEDIYLLYNLHYADRDYYSLEYLKSVQGILKPRDLQGYLKQLSEIPGKIYEFPSEHFPETAGIGMRALDFLMRCLGWNVWIYVLLIVMLWKKRDKRTILRILLMLFGGLIGVLYILKTGHLPRRALIGIRLAIEILSVFMVLKLFCKKGRNRSPRVGRVIGVIYLIAVMMTGAFRLILHIDMQEPTETQMVLQTIRENTDDYYLLDSGLLWADRMGVKDSRQFSRKNYRNFFQNMILSGGWLAETEAMRSSAQQYGIQNPMLDLIDHPHMFYVARKETVELFVPWMLEQFERRSGNSIRAEVLYDGSEVVIVRFLTDGGGK